MDVVTPLLYGILLPAGVCAGGLVVAFVSWPARRPAGLSGAAAVAHALAYALAFGILFGWPEFPPLEHWRWLPCVAVGSAVLGGVDAQPELARKWRWIARIAAAAVLAGLITPPWAAPRAVWLLLAAVALLVHWWLLRTLVDRAGSKANAVILAVALFGVGGVLVLSGNAKLAQSAGAVAAAFAGHFVVTLAMAKRSHDVSFAGLGSALLVSHALLGYFNNYSDVDGWVFVLAAALPFAAFAAEIPSVRRWGGWRVTLVRISTCIVAVAAIVAWSVYRSPPP